MSRQQQREINTLKEKVEALTERLEVVEEIMLPKEEKRETLTLKKDKADG